MKKMICVSCLVVAACTPVSSGRDPGNRQKTTPTAVTLPVTAPGAVTVTTMEGGSFGETRRLPEKSFAGYVVEVIDGEKLVVQTGDQELAKVRLADISAPGLTQPYGLRARDYLSRNCKPRSVADVLMMNGIEFDKNKFWVGRVLCYASPSARPVDVVVEQIKHGVAWVARESADNTELKALEAEARKKRRGLWIDPNPIPPWDWADKK